MTNDLQWDDADSNASDGDDGEEGGGGLGGLLGDYGSDDDDEGEHDGDDEDPPAPVLVNQGQPRGPVPARGQVAAAAAPQITKPPSGQATHRAPQLERKSLDQVQIDPAMRRLVPGAVQRRKVAPAGKGVKRKATGPVAPAAVAKPASMAFAAPAQPPPPRADEFDSFMSEINGL